MADRELSQIVQDWESTATRLGRLTEREERALSERARKGDKRAQRALVEHNLPLVLSLVRKFCRQYSATISADMLHEGIFAAYSCAKKWDPDKGTFGTLLGWWLRGKLGRFLAQDNIIRIPAGAKKLSIAVLMPYGLIDVFSAQYYPRQELERVIEELEDRVDNERARELILSVLSKKHKQNLVLLFGLFNVKPMSLVDVGKISGHSRQRAQQIRNKAFDAVRNKTSNIDGYPVKKPTTREKCLLQNLSKQEAGIIASLLNQDGEKVFLSDRGQTYSLLSSNVTASTKSYAEKLLVYLRGLQNAFSKNDKS